MSRGRILSIAWLKARYGGAHHYLATLAAAMVRHGFAVDVVVNADPKLAEFSSQMRSVGVYVHEVAIEQQPVARSAITLDRLIGEIRPDVVHFNASARLIRAMAARMRAFAHKRFRTCFTMHAALLRDDEASPKTLRGRLPFSNSRRGWHAKKRFARLFDRIISVTKCNLPPLIEACRLPIEKLTWIPNGVDTTRFLPQHHKRVANSGPPVIGACGSLIEVKRFDLLIRSVHRATNGFLIPLRIAGSGPDEGSLRELARRLGMGDTVTLLGHQTNVARYLRSLDVFAMSSDSEACPYAQLEAMASGLPSVVTSVGDLPYIVRDGHDGFVVPPGDVGQFASRLQSLVENAELRARMGASARRRVCEEFSQERSLERTRQVFEELATGTRSGSDNR